MFPKMPDVESKLRRCHPSLSTDGFFNLWSVSMASVVGLLIISLLCMSMTVTERLSSDEYSELEWATASTNPNELVLVLGLFFLFFFL